MQNLDSLMTDYQKILCWKYNLDCKQQVKSHSSVLYLINMPAVAA